MSDPPKRRGRPSGSKNKPKTTPPTVTTEEAHRHQIKTATTKSGSDEHLGIVWARDNGEYWPASLLEITDDGFIVSFLGFGQRHNLLLPSSEICFEEPARQRKPPPPTTPAVAVDDFFRKRKRSRQERHSDEDAVSSSSSSCAYCGKRLPTHAPGRASHMKHCKARAEEAEAASVATSPRTPTKKAKAVAVAVEATTPKKPPPVPPPPQPTPDAKSTTALVVHEEAANSKGFKFKVPVQGCTFECAACAGTGSGDQMLRCTGGCGSWVHACCAGLGDVAMVLSIIGVSTTYTCPECSPPPAWQHCWLPPGA